MKYRAFYIRTSTANQGFGLESQQLALENYAKASGITDFKLFSDEVSGRKCSRPGLDTMLASAKRGEISEIVVYSLSRYSRSVKHLLESLDLFGQLGIGFISITENLNTQTPTGRAIVTIISAIAQLEAELIKERVKNGLANAKSKGVRLGRPKQIKNTDLIVHLAGQKMSYKEIARLAGCSTASVCRELKLVSKIGA